MAHKALAKAVTSLIHGKEIAEAVESSSEALFGPIHQKISGAIEWPELNANISLEQVLKKSSDKFDMEALLDTIFQDLPNVQISKAKLEGSGTPLLEILVESKLYPSKGQARKDLESGGVYVNNVRERNFQRAVTSAHLLFGKHILLRKGKKNYVVVTAK